jgi:hypothetical protein
MTWTDVSVFLLVWTAGTLIGLGISIIIIKTIC